MAYQLYFAKCTSTNDFHNLKVACIHTAAFDYFTGLLIWKAIKPTSGLEPQELSKANTSQQLNFKTHIFEGSFRRFCCVWGQGSHNHRPTIESRPGKRNKAIKILSNPTVWQFNWASIDSPKALRYTVHSEDLGRNAQDFLASVARPSCLQIQALVIPMQSNPHQAEITPFPASKI